MSTNIELAFKQKALVAYITLGDPSVAFTTNCCEAMLLAGVDMIEIGLPFSDPIADGPVIQAAHTRALSTGEDVSISSALTLVEHLKSMFPNKAVVLMGATNLVLQFGYADFFKQASAQGCDGIVLPDSVVEMSLPHLSVAKQNNVDIIQLISPLCSLERMKLIMNQASGFVYLISSTGLTGERESFSSELSKVVQQMKQFKDVPVAIGFGISKPEHCKQLCEFSDGVIVGSYFTKLIQQYLPDEDRAIAALVAEVQQFKAAC